MTKRRIQSILGASLVQVLYLSILLLFGFTLASCAGGNGRSGIERSRNPQRMVDSSWEWVTTITPTSKIDAAQPERYTILLKKDGNLQAMFDCNRGGGGYQISEGKLSFGPLISTRMACPPDSQDTVFMSDLQRVQTFFVEDGFLYLELPYDSGTMKFRQAAEGR